MTPLVTERLEVRNFRVDDAPALREMVLQYQASAYAVYDHKWPTSADEIRAVAEWFAEGDRFLAVCLRDTGRFIGFVSLGATEGTHDTAYSLGYCFDFDYHGRGYATEACQVALDHAFDALGADKVTTGTAAANQPSCRLLARLGFRRVGEQTTSFWTNADGAPIEFLAYSFVLDRADRIGASSRG